MKLWIDGDWAPGERTEKVRSPWDGRVVAEVEVGGAAHVERSVTATVRGASAMARLAAWQRREILERIVRGLEVERDALATAICDEAGKPIQYARAEVARAAATFRFAADEAGRLVDDSVDLGAVATGVGRFGVVRRMPVGPIAAIAPFNFPLNLVAHKVAPAIAAGCSTVLKPASQTPTAALRLAAICAEAGLPPGGLNVVVCDRGTAGPLTTDPRLRLLSFTGSPLVGWRLKEQAPRKKVVLELGGDAAVIVHHDAPIAEVAARVAIGAYAYAGQVCISVQRIFVHRERYAAFREAFCGALAQLPVGDPRRDDVVCGPLIDAANADRIETWIAEAVAGGARVTGGQREGSLIRPALLENVPRTAAVACQEAFGPLAILAPYDSEEEAIAKVNDSAFGLQAGVFTDSTKFLWRCFEQLEVGAVIHNDCPTFRADHMPYGGVKESGFGREGLRYALEDYTERRLLALKP